MGLWGVAAFYVAGLIGAGFASGQELAVFFVSYGRAGILGAIWAAALLCMGTHLILRSCSRHRVSSYGQLFQKVEPRWSWALDLLYAVFLLVGTSVMLAGIAASVGSKLAGSAARLASALLVYAVLQAGVKGVLRVSGWIAPVLTFGLCAASLLRLKQAPLAWAELGAPGGLQAALEAGTLYACYNLGFAMSFLAASHQYLNTKGQRWALALVGSGALGLTMLLLCLALSTLPPQELGDAFPLIHLVEAWGTGARRLYAVLLWCAMFSTAVANSLALGRRVGELKGVSWPTAAAISVGAPFALSHFGFTWLVRMAYPALGLAGLWLLARLLWDTRLG
ncbi:MAG TPA: hypothetical protein GX393_01060 [Firmicutes bacterium]|nr:hypothetical protein [Bacillota bacterium]